MACWTQLYPPRSLFFIPSTRMSGLSRWLFTKLTPPDCNMENRERAKAWEESSVGILLVMLESAVKVRKVGECAEEKGGREWESRNNISYKPCRGILHREPGQWELLHGRKNWWAMSTILVQVGGIVSTSRQYLANASQHGTMHVQHQTRFLR